MQSKLQLQAESTLKKSQIEQTDMFQSQLSASASQISNPSLPDEQRKYLYNQLKITERIPVKIHLKFSYDSLNQKILIKENNDILGQITPLKDNILFDDKNYNILYLTDDLDQIQQKCENFDDFQNKRRKLQKLIDLQQCTYHIEIISVCSAGNNEDDIITEKRIQILSDIDNSVYKELPITISAEAKDMVPIVIFNVRPINFFNLSYKLQKLGIVFVVV